MKTLAEKITDEINAGWSPIYAASKFKVRRERLLELSSQHQPLKEAIDNYTTSRLTPKVSASGVATTMEWVPKYKRFDRPKDGVSVSHLPMNSPIYKRRMGVS